MAAVFTCHGDKSPGAADERRSVFSPLMNSLKSIQVLCQSNFLPALSSCTQISSMHVMYRSNDGACTYTRMQLKRNKADEAQSLQPVEVDSTKSLRALGKAG